MVRMHADDGGGKEKKRGWWKCKECWDEQPIPAVS